MRQKIFLLVAIMLSGGIVIGIYKLLGYAFRALARF